jgi:multidrug efflux pump subunit AcrB
MPSITEFSLNNSRLTILLIAFIVLFGVATLIGFPSREDPEITIREAVVSAYFPGMAPDRMEDLISRRLEEKIREIPGIEDITSSSKTGVSVIHVFVYDRYFDLEPIWQDLRNKMEDIKADLPSGTLGPYVDDDFGLVAAASIALTADGFTLAEMREVARELRDRLYAVPGVKRIDLYGVQDERIWLEVSNAKLAQFGLNPGAVMNTLQTQNIILPGGKINAAGTEVVIEPSGSFESVEDIEGVLIEVPGTEQVAYLRDLVTVKRAYVDPPDQPVFFQGRPAVVLAVSMVRGANIIEFGERLRAKVAAAEGGLPIGYTLDFATFQPALVDRAVSDALNNVYQTFAVVFAVVVLFLGLRTGAIVGSIVPMSVLAALIVMSTIHIELQRVSIAAVIIALGLLVDNGIVMAEDIRRRIEVDVDRRQAAIQAGRELSRPLLTSSLTTVMAFMPLMLADHVAGEYTRSLSLVILITLLSSWFLAMYVTPTLCYWFINVKGEKGAAEGGDPYQSRFYRVYRTLLRAVLRQRVLFIMVMVAALGVSVYAFRFVTQQFFPFGDRNQFLVYIDLPAGTNIRETEASVKRFTYWLGDRAVNPEVVDAIAYVGAGGPRFFLSLSPIDPDPHRAFVIVNTVNERGVPEMVTRTHKHFLENHPELRAQVKQMWLGPAEIGMVQIRLVGPGADELARLAEEVKAGFRSVPGTIDIKDDWENRTLKVMVLVDQAQARRAGVTSEDIANSLNAFFNGIEITDYREGDTDIPILLRAEGAERDNLAQFATINVYSSSQGTNVPLLQIASFRPVFQHGKIKRRNQERTLTVSAKNVILQADDLMKELRPTLDGLEFKEGYRWEVGGELESSVEAQAALFANVPFAGAVILALMVWQFRSFRRTMIIALAIPLSFIGAVIGLLATNALFGFMATLGLLSLAGIIINNAIVLIDRIDLERERGLNAYDAVVAASVKRFRPILMTTATTILGLMPLIFFGGDLWFAMAVVIAFGLGVGTILTLGVVPALYTLFFRVPVHRRAAA